MLKAEQRGWIKGRDDCRKSADLRACVGEIYRLTYVDTDPPTLIGERGDQVSLIYRQPGRGGTKFQGRNEQLWEDKGGIRVVWAHGAAEMRCAKRPEAPTPAGGGPQ